MWMEFETRMRKVIKDIVAPVLEKTLEDREFIINLEKQAEEHQRWLEFLENAMCQGETVNTVFD